MKNHWKILLLAFLATILMSTLIFTVYKIYITKIQQPTVEEFTLISDLLSQDLSSSCFDVDENKVTNSKESDICFGASVGSSVFYVISPVNNVSAKTMGTSMVNIEDCKNNLSNFTHGSIPELEINNHICILTNNNTIALLTIKNSQRLSSTSIEITIEFQALKNNSLK